MPWENPKTIPCANCDRMRCSGGKPLHPLCRDCRPKVYRGKAKHGELARYDKGKCRCDLCKEAKRIAMREYFDKRKAAGNPVDFESYRTRETKTCPTCGREFLGRLEVRFCSRACNPRIQIRYHRSARLRRMSSEGRAFLLRAEAVAQKASAGTTGGKLIWVQGLCLFCGTSFLSPGVSSRYCSRDCRAEYRRRSGWIDWSERLRIYRRDEWMCQICGGEASLGAKGRLALTLDHIVPRVHGGSDDPSNLRLAHAWCNSMRGDLTWRTDEEVRRAVTA